MQVRMITGVRLDNRKQVNSLAWQWVETLTGQFVLERLPTGRRIARKHLESAAVIAQELVLRRRRYFLLKYNEAGEKIVGPEARYVARNDGTEGIESDDPRWTIDMLPRI